MERHYPAYKSDQAWIEAAYDYFEDTLQWGHLKVESGDRVAIFGRDCREHTLGNDIYSDTLFDGPFIGM